jgi:hypothetical protein
MPTQLSPETTRYDQPQLTIGDVLAYINDEVANENVSNRKWALMADGAHICPTCLVEESKEVLGAFASQDKQWLPIGWVAKVDMNLTDECAHCHKSSSAEDEPITLTWTFTYEIVTEESAEAGEAEEIGFICEGRDYPIRGKDIDLSIEEIRKIPEGRTGSLEDLAEDLRRFDCGIQIDCANRQFDGVMSESSSSQDMHTGEYRSETCHVKFPLAVEDATAWKILDCIYEAIECQPAWLLAYNKEGTDASTTQEVHVFRWIPMSNTWTPVKLSNQGQFDPINANINRWAAYLIETYPKHSIRVSHTWPTHFNQFKIGLKFH